MVLTVADTTVNELTSFEYNTTLRDEAGNLLQLANIVSAKLTLYDYETLEIINDRDGQDVLNANNVTIGATDGQLDWDVQDDDNAIVTAGLTPGEREAHVALFTITYDTDKVLRKELEILVRQLGKTP